MESFYFKPLQEQYSHYHALPAPLDRILFPVQAILGKSMERLFKQRGLPLIASTYILKFQKPADVRRPEYSLTN
jgi:hypothetical protein